MSGHSERSSEYTQHRPAEPTLYQLVAQHLVGGSLNLNVHYHVAIPDGVFTFSEDDAPAAFHRLPAPDSTELQEIASEGSSPRCPSAATPKATTPMRCLSRRSPPDAAALIEALTCTPESSFLPPIARGAKGSCPTARDRR